MKRIQILFLTITLVLVPVVSAQAQDNSQSVNGYVQVIDGCVVVRSGCLNVRSGPGTNYSKVRIPDIGPQVLRVGAVVYVSESVTDDTGRVWYRVVPDASIPHPERVTTQWWIAAEFTAPANVPPKPAYDSGKKIVVDISAQTETAYNADGTIFMVAPVSTGNTSTPTPLGKFKILSKTPSRYMQGPLPGITDINGQPLTDVYDLPGVPWTMYFTSGGAALHGAYWHNEFGKKHSHGCVNLTIEDAYKLYAWAAVGTRVIVQP